MILKHFFNKTAVDIPSLHGQQKNQPTDLPVAGLTRREKATGLDCARGWLIKKR